MSSAWLITNVDAIRQFLPAAANLLKGEVTVCIEHADTCKPAIELFSRFRANRSFRPIRDTIAPRTQLYYCCLSTAFASQLAELAGHYELHEFIWHLRGFDRERMIFYSHDVCDRAPIELSPRLPEQLLRRIANDAEADLEPADIGLDWDEVWSLRGEKQDD